MCQNSTKCRNFLNTQLFSAQMHKNDYGGKAEETLPCEERVMPSKFVAQHPFAVKYANLRAENKTLAGRVYEGLVRKCRDIDTSFESIVNALSEQLKTDVKVRINIGDNYSQTYEHKAGRAPYVIPVAIIPGPNQRNEKEGNSVELLFKIPPADLSVDQCMFLGAAWPDLEDILTNALKYQIAKHASHKDTLTNLLNRRGFEPLLEEKIAILKRDAYKSEKSKTKRVYTGFALLAVDIDYFKRVNDAFGHKKGDEVLQSVAKYLQAIARRQNDSVARVGGEEFIILLDNCDMDYAKKAAENLRESICQQKCKADYGLLPEILKTKKDPKDFTGKISVSIGVAHSSEFEQVEELKEVLPRLADLRLYDAKRTGRNKVVAKLTKSEA